ncbi:MAG: hypothetical protein R3D03_01330 [Geminicoccaceae bacterium]
MGSPRLCSSPGSVPRSHLEGLGIEVVHDQPGVGSNLRDHLTFTASAKSPVRTPMTVMPDFTGRPLPRCNIFSPAAVRSPPVSSRPAASGMPIRMPARPTSSFIRAGDRYRRRSSVHADGGGPQLVLSASAFPRFGPLQPGSAAALQIDPNYLEDPRDRELDRGAQTYPEDLAQRC